MAASSSTACSRSHIRPRPTTEAVTATTIQSSGSVPGQRCATTTQPTTITRLEPTAGTHASVRGDDATMITRMYAKLDPSGATNTWNWPSTTSNVAQAATSHGHAARGVRSARPSSPTPIRTHATTTFSPTDSTLTGVPIRVLTAVTTSSAPPAIDSAQGPKRAQTARRNARRSSSAAAGNGST